MQQANLLKPESPLEILLLDTKIIPAVAEVISEAAPVERLPETESEMSHSNIDIMEAHLNKRFDFRYNKVIGQIEYKFKEESKYKILSDYIANSILRELQKNKIGAYSTSLRSLLNSNFSEVYDPFVEYFNSLPEWDGQTDHIAALAATVKTNDDELWQACFKKWLVAMVACALDDETINHTVIVFSDAATAAGYACCTCHFPRAVRVSSVYNSSDFLRPVPDEIRISSSCFTSGPTAPTSSGR